MLPYCDGALPESVVVTVPVRVTLLPVVNVVLAVRLMPPL